MLKKTKDLINKGVEKFTHKDITSLQDLIKYHSDLYYNKQEPIISDFEYDVLFKKLQYLEEKFNILDKESLKVGSAVIESTFKKVNHSRPMISLGNTYNEEDLNDFDERVKKHITAAWEEVNKIEYVLEFKFDGLGVELIYKEWLLVQAITRGNWVEWEDVTQNVLQIANIPKKISYKKYLEVRWEVILPISSFDVMNEKAKKEGTKIFSNPRNAASWSLRMKDNSITKQRNLKFFVYDLANFDEFRLEKWIDEYYRVIKDLEKFWFEISSYFNKCEGIWKIISSINNFWDVKSKIDFEIDGLVLKVNNITLWESIGFTQHHPRYAIAYKFPAEILTTQINSVEHQVGRTGTITPVANLEPINIGWVIVRRATLHNYEEVESLWVHIGDTIFIKRAWEVIPKIISVVKEKDIWDREVIIPPKHCPSCETEVLKDDWKVRFYCPNKIDCPAQNSQKLIFAVGKQWFNIDWLWMRQIEIFLKEWIIHNLVDIFTISTKSEEILALEWFQDKSVENLIIWVENAKKISVATFITALWIAWVGKKTSKTIAKLFTSADSILEFPFTEDSLVNLEDIGPEIAKNVVDYFSNEAHMRILEELINILDIEYYEPLVIDNNWGISIFLWKKVCITGSFLYKDKKISRDDLVIQLEAVGWDFMSSVSKKTDFLLAWEKAWSKLKKANDFWVEVIDLEYFYKNI